MGCICLDASHRTLRGAEHANGEVCANDLESCVRRHASEVARSASEIEQARSTRKAQTLERRLSPIGVESKGDEAIDQLIARCNGIEHGPNNSRLLLALGKGGSVLSE